MYSHLQKKLENCIFLIFYAVLENNREYSGNYQSLHVQPKYSDIFTL